MGLVHLDCILTGKVEFYCRYACLIEGGDSIGTVPGAG